MLRDRTPPRPPFLEKPALKSGFFHLNLANSIKTLYTRCMEPINYAAEIQYLMAERDEEIRNLLAEEEEYVREVFA